MVIPSNVRKRINYNAILTETNCILAHLTWKRNFWHILYYLYWAAVKKEVAKIHQEQSTINDSSLSGSPHPFYEIPGLWLRLFKMTEQFFAQESTRASISNTLISILIHTVVTAIFSVISSFLSGSMQRSNIPPEYPKAVAGKFALYSACCLVFITPVGFYLSNGLLCLGARILGGVGDYETQTYLQALYTVPLGFVTSSPEKVLQLDLIYYN